MNKASLVMFTLLIQISVGVLAATLFHLCIRTGGMGPIPVSVLSICLGLIVAGLLSAMVHLKNPKNAPHAVSNIRRSWLSREIMAVSLLACGIGLLWILTWLGIFRGLRSGRLLRLRAIHQRDRRFLSVCAMRTNFDVVSTSLLHL